MAHVRVAQPSAAPAHRGPEGGPARVGRFLRHAGEMFLAMLIGMVAGGALLGASFAAVQPAAFPGQTPGAVAAQHPVLVAVVVCLVMAAGMAAPMVAWMRHRGMARRPVVEMAAAMAAPLVPVFALVGLGILPGAAACCAYCGAMALAMLADMLYRRDYYATGHQGHLAPAA